MIKKKGTYETVDIMTEPKNRSMAIFNGQSIHSKPRRLLIRERDTTDCKVGEHSSASTHPSIQPGPGSKNIEGREEGIPIRYIQATSSFQASSDS